VMRDHALLLYKAEQTLAAHDVFEVAMARTIETFGRDNIEFARVLQLRALVRARSAPGSELHRSALADQTAALDILAGLLPEDHPERGMAMLDMGWLLREAGDAAGALHMALAAERARAPSRSLLITAVSEALEAGVIGGERATREMFRVAQSFLASRAGQAHRQSAYRAALGSGPVGEAYRELTDHQRLEERLQGELARLASLPLAERDRAAEQALGVRIGENAARIAAIIAETAGKAPAMDELLGRGVMEIEEVQALLGPREALIVMDYSARPGDPHVIHAVTRERALYVPIRARSEDLARAVDDLRGSIDLQLGVRGGIALKAREREAPPKFAFAAAAWLYGQSFAAVEGALAGKEHLYVLQRGALASLPPQLLTRNRATSLAEADWLLRHVAITVVPSVSALRLARTGPSEAPDAPFLGFSNPRFAAGLAALPETTGEVRAVSAALGAREGALRDGEAASEAAVKRAELSRYGVLYFATHGLVAGDVLDGAALGEPALALTAGGGEDGLLRASEIARLTLDADLVVLSACNTAVGDGAGGEALSGLAQAFTYAGARALLVSHWPVESQSAVALMTDIFARRAADPDLAAAEAQRQAMLAMLDHPEWNHPAYWAPFILVGTPDR